MWLYKTCWLDRVKAIGINLSALDESDWHIRNDKYVLNETDGKCLAWYLREGGWIPYIGETAEDPEVQDEYLISWRCTKEPYKSDRVYIDILEWTPEDGFIDTLNRAQTAGGFEVIAWHELPKKFNVKEYEK